MRTSVLAAFRDEVIKAASSNLTDDDIAYNLVMDGLGLNRSATDDERVVKSLRKVPRLETPEAAEARLRASNRAVGALVGGTGGALVGGLTGRMTRVPGLGVGGMLLGAAAGGLAGRGLSGGRVSPEEIATRQAEVERDYRVAQGLLRNKRKRQGMINEYFDPPPVE
jgi:hypothetical protein